MSVAAQATEACTPSHVTRVTSHASLRCDAPVVETLRMALGMRVGEVLVDRVMERWRSWCACARNGMRRAQQTGYNSSSCTCHRWRSCRKYCEKARNWSTASTNQPSTVFGSISKTYVVPGCRPALGRTTPPLGQGGSCPPEVCRALSPLCLPPHRLLADCRPLTVDGVGIALRDLFVQGGHVQ